MTYKGVNFRATAGWVADAATDTYDLGAAYPVTRGGLTFGWATSVVSEARDRATGYDSRICGSSTVQNTAPVDFQIDLPSTGAASIRIALGDFSNGRTIRVQLVDGSTVFATINGTTSFPQWLDATGAALSELTVTGWPGANTAINHTFTTTTFIVRMGDGSSGGFSSIAHVGFDLAAAPSAAISWTEGADVTAIAVSVGTGTTTATMTWTEGADTVAITGTASPVLGTITTPVLKNNTGTILANETGVVVNVYNTSTGALVVQKIGQTSSAGGIVTVTDALIVPAINYAYEVVLTSNGAALATGDGSMSLRIDTAEWISGALLIGETGGGVLAENVATAGTDGDGYLANDVTLPGDAGKEICGRITTIPAGLNLFAFEDGSTIVSADADGTYVAYYQLYVDYVATGAETPIIYTFGDGSASGAMAWTEGADITAIAITAIPPAGSSVLGWTEEADIVAIVGNAGDSVGATIFFIRQAWSPRQRFTP